MRCTGKRAAVPKTGTAGTAGGGKTKGLLTGPRLPLPARRGVRGGVRGACSPRPGTGVVETFMRLPLLVALLSLPAAAPSSDWPHYGGSPDQARYSPLSQITRENVG